MWIFTQHGMVSAVAHRDIRGAFLVRARSRAHLTHFVGTYPCEIRRTPNADYEYRAVMSYVGFCGAMEQAASAVDYDNFKNRVDSGKDGAYARVLHQVWDCVMRALAKNEKWNYRHVSRDSENELPGKGPSKPLERPSWLPAKKNKPDKALL